MRSIEYLYNYEQILLGYTTSSFESDPISAYRRGCFGSDSGLNSKEQREKAIEILRYAFKDVLGWDANVCKQKITAEVLEEQKLTNLIKYLDLPEEFNGRIDPAYFASLIYPDQVKFDRNKLTIDIYKSVLNNDNVVNKEDKISYPKRFFQGEEGRQRACRCLNYALQKESFHSLEEVYKTLADNDRTFIKKAKLLLALDNFETPVDLLHEALDPSQQNDFLFAYYKFEYLFKTVKLRKKKFTVE